IEDEYVNGDGGELLIFAGLGSLGEVSRRQNEPDQRKDEAEGYDLALGVHIARYSVLKQRGDGSQNAYVAETGNERAKGGGAERDEPFMIILPDCGRIGR